MTGGAYHAAVDDEWGEYAEGWDHDEGARTYARAAFASLLRVLGHAGIALEGARVVDFGCGTGLLTERLADAGADVMAIDTSPAMLAVLDAKVDRHGWTTVTTTTDLSDARPGSDLIVCSSVCSFLDDYPGTVEQLVHLLRPGGLFIQWDWERAGDDHGLGRSEIADALQGADLEHVVVDTAFEVEAEDQVMRPLVGHGRRPVEP